MVTRNSDDSQSPWLPVYSQGVGRDPVAPSKPAMPTTSPFEPRPEPVDTDDASDEDVIAPIAPPAPEEILPWSPSAPAPSTPVADASTLSPAGTMLTPAMGDVYRELGDDAVRRASLSASGAPTPARGKRQAPPAGDEPPVDASSGHDSATTDPAPTDSGSSDSSVDKPGADEWPAAIAVPSAALADDGAPMYTPRFTAVEPPVAPAPDNGDGDTEDPARASAPRKWWSSVPVLVIAGLIVMGGVGVGLYALLTPQNEVELTPEVIVASPETPALDPIAIEDPTDFQAALPGVVGTYALTSVETPELRSLDLPVRAAEASDLTYDDQQTTLSLRAIQHFDQEAAVAQFEALAAEGSDREPVDAGGVDLGERATVPSDAGQSIVWRNGTAVFELTGPADAVEEFYASYPL